VEEGRRCVSENDFSSNGMKQALHLVGYRTGALGCM
jgi:hypothetical protein